MITTTTTGKIKNFKTIEPHNTSFLVMNLPLTSKKVHKKLDFAHIEGSCTNSAMKTT
jgi:hypothetical protein